MPVLGFNPLKSIYILISQRTIAIHYYYIHNLDNTKHRHLVYITNTLSSQHLVFMPLFDEGRHAWYNWEMHTKLVENLQGRGRLAGLWSRCTWEDNIKTCIQETVFVGFLSTEFIWLTASSIGRLLWTRMESVPISPDKASITSLSQRLICGNFSEYGGLTIAIIYLFATQDFFYLRPLKM